MLEEKFAQGSSFLHRRDPRGKIVAAFTFTVTVALLHSYSLLLTSFSVSFVLLFLSKLPLPLVARRLLLVNSFTLFLWLTLPLTYGGEEVYHFFNLPLSIQGIELALRITLKTNTIVIAIITMLATSTIADLGHALDRLKLPTKLVFLLLYSYRYVFVIYSEYQRLLRAARLRSFTPKTNLHTYKTFAYLFGMTLVNSYNRSQRVHQAMVLRGFSGRLVTLTRYHLDHLDMLFLSFFLLLTLLFLIVHFHGTVPCLSF